MASPLCVTLTVVIIIIITSEVKTTFGISYSYGQGDGARATVEPDVLPALQPKSAGYTKTMCNVQYTITYGYSRFHVWNNYAEISQSDGVVSTTLRFTVRAASDAHILLAPSDNATIGHPVYEIVLGAGRNTFSDIRRALRTGTKSNLQTPELLSGFEPRSFWIRLSGDGTIGVGKEGDDTPFMAWQDPQPLKIKFFAFCTWNGVFGKWEYNCPKKNTTPNSSNNEPPIPVPTEPEPNAEARLTDAERLRRNLFGDYNPYTIPTLKHSPTLKIYAAFVPQNIDIIEKESTAILLGQLALTWKDEKLRWNPADYDGINHITVPTGQIWIPELILYNAADGKGCDLMSALSLLHVDCNGTVYWTPKTQMKALCNLNLEFWPFDKQVCTFTLGVWGQSDKVSLKNMVDESGVTDFSTTGIEKAQWVLEELTLHEQAENDLHPYFEDKYYSDESEQDDADDDDIEMKNTALEFKVKLRRSNGIYTWTVFAPLYVVLIFIAASFWMETNQSYRLFFGLICLTTNFIVLMSFFSQFPGEVSKTPHIISMYSNALILSTFSILTTIVVMLTSECKSESAPPPIILTFLSYLPDIVTNMHRVHRYPVNTQIKKLKNSD
ncbi:neuronal acetylcholine receptor subunit beta-3-like isoform X2 [Neocloeon triangulifer]|uniref:neuronal acetylcholine receptor subunit beta-3-like isoform X2 n=1 Tax=Neocloeon triangulifer TaxID=2078957 RepID=UPI00286EB924|nr:neuronal acetylcholine receptor subunit beta-3-like isoform X2 [Neocloeon triangulifer]